MGDMYICKGCGVERSASMFQSTAKGTRFKTCVKCHEKTVRYRDARAPGIQKWRARKLEEDPTYNVRNTAAYRARQLEKDPDGFRERERQAGRKQRAKKIEEDPDGFRKKVNAASKACRDRQLAIDPDAFRKRERARNNKYREANRDALLARNREYDRLSPKRRLKTFKTPVRCRGYEWALDDDDAMTMMTGPCVYCGILPDDCVHGLDRMDNAKGYTPENTVGCCGTCNMMKRCLDARTFVKRCAHITHMEDHTDAWSDMVPGVYRTYRSNAKKAGRVFELTQEMYDDLAQRPCMYCQRAITETNRSGIDRIDNDGGYVSGNLAPACSECNFMRGTLPVWTFLEQAARIAARAEVLEIPDMPACHSSMTRRQKKTPSV